MNDKEHISENSCSNTEADTSEKNNENIQALPSSDGTSDTKAESAEQDSTVTKDGDNGKKSEKKPGKKRIKKRFIALIAAASVLAALVILYLLFAFAPFRPFSSLRNLYVNTAMTTGDHQYLVNILPKSVVDKEYTPADYNVNVIGGMSNLLPKDETAEESSAAESTDITEPTDTEAVEEPIPTEPEEPVVTDILGQQSLTVGEPDSAGYIVSVNDIEQGIVVSDIEGYGYYGTYRGKIMLIDDPSRVYLGTTPYKHEEGLRIKAMMEYYGAIAGINASGFNDPNDSGHGGDVIGLTCSQGEFWGTPVSYYGSVLITENNKLVVGNVSDWQNYAIREGIQFGPVLIADGVAQFTDAAGFGLHPRTAIGQREDGVIVFLIIDGRRIGWSNGCTVKDMIDVLQKYGVVNAACCDGGSSSVLAYRGEVITKNSSKNPNYGRRLPNAWLVRPKETANDE